MSVKACQSQSGDCDELGSHGAEADLTIDQKNM